MGVAPLVAMIAQADVQPAVAPVQPLAVASAVAAPDVLLLVGVLVIKVVVQAVQATVQVVLAVRVVAVLATLIALAAAARIVSLNAHNLADLLVLVCVQAAPANVPRLVADVLDAVPLVALLAVVVAMAVTTHVILSVLAVQLLAVGGVLLSVKDVPLHALPIVATLVQMIALVIVA